MKDILNSHSVSTLKKEISKTNIKGYSKMKKNEIVNLMLKNKDRFTHIKMNDKKSNQVVKKETTKVEPKKMKKFIVKKKEEPKVEPKKMKKFIVKKKEKPKPKKMKKLIVKKKEQKNK